MISDIFEHKRCFKLVCGAGNEDAVEVEKLVALYAKAGANYFDLSAREEVVQAAFNGLRRVIPDKKIKNYYLNVSVGIKGDPHVNKAKIDTSKCIACGKCLEVCIHKAVLSKNDEYQINKIRCIGCGVCITECPEAAISSYSQNKPFEEVLPPLIAMGIHSIELHAVSDDEIEVAKQWKTINKVFDGTLSLCIDRSHLGDIQLIRRIKLLIQDREKYSTIIQADGAPMSGCDDRYETTLQALATAQIIQRANLPIYLMLSGGTNSKTAELAKTFNIKAHGIALGSYARMIVRKFIDREDFLHNKEVFNKSLEIANELVNKTIKYMG